MANFSGTGRDKLVRCKNEKCPCNDPAKKAEPWIRPVKKYIIREPDEFDHYHRALRWMVTWYCCHCNNPLPLSAVPSSPDDVIGVNELKG